MVHCFYPTYECANLGKQIENLQDASHQLEKCNSSRTLKITDVIPIGHPDQYSRPPTSYTSSLLL